MIDSNSENANIPPVERVRQEVDRWLDAVRTTGERAMETLGLSAGHRIPTPPADVIEFPEEIIVHVELPGIPAEIVELSLVGNMLTVSANRVRQEYSSDAKMHLQERACGRLQRSIPLPAAIDDSSIRAETRDGVLVVTLKKAIPTPCRSIPVSTGKTF